MFGTNDPFAAFFDGHGLSGRNSGRSSGRSQRAQQDPFGMMMGGGMMGGSRK